MLKHTCFAVSGISNVPSPSTFHYTYTHTYRHYVEVVVSYIPLELEFSNFVAQIRAEYDSWLNQAGAQSKLSAVSLQGTLSETLEEVHMC